VDIAREDHDVVDLLALEMVEQLATIRAIPVPGVGIEAVVSVGERRKHDLLSDHTPDRAVVARIAERV